MMRYTIYLMVVLMLVGVASAVDTYEYLPAGAPWTPTTTGSSNSDHYGNGIRIQNDYVYIMNVTLFGTSESTQATLFNGSIGTDLSKPANQLDSCAVVGGVCVFSGSYAAMNGEKLWLMFNGTAKKHSRDALASDKNGTNLDVLVDGHGVYAPQATRIITFWGDMFLVDIARIGVKVSPPAAGNNTGVVDLYFRNQSGSIKTVFGEGENFFVLANYSNSSTGASLSGGNCSFKIEDGIIESDGTNSNFSTCGSGCDYVVYSDNFSVDSPSDAVLWGVHFDACHHRVSTDDILVDICGNVTVIDNTAFSDCGSPSPVFVWVNNCTGLSSIEVKISSTGSTYNKGADISGLEADITHLNVSANYVIDVFYNSSSDFFETNESYEYYAHGDKKVYAECTYPDSGYDKAASETLTVVNSPPFLSIDSVNNSGGSFHLYDGVVLDYYAGVYEWSVTYSDDDLQYGNLSIFNVSGHLVRDWTGLVPPEQFLVNATTLVQFAGNPFTITLWANDTAGNSSFVTLDFNMTDISPPICTGLNDVFHENNTLFTLSPVCEDDSFFSWNISCDNGFSNYTDDLNVTSWTPEFTFMVNDSVNCSIRYCDGHTDVLSKDFKSEKDGKTVRTYSKGYDNALVPLGTDVEDVEVYRKDDRVSFKFKYKEKDAKDKGKVLTYRFTYFASLKSYYLHDEKYKGWIRDSLSETWLDMNLLEDPDAVVRVSKAADGLFDIEVDTVLQDLEFSSLGEFNCVDANFSIVPIYVFREETELGGDCPDTTENMMFLIAVIFVGTALMFLGFIGSPLFGVFGGITYIFWGLMSVGCSRASAWIFAGMGLVALVYFAVKRI